MRRLRFTFVLCWLLSGASLLPAHDLFLRPESFFVATNHRVEIPVLNGTFTASEAAVARDRIADLSFASPGGVVQLDAGAWTVHGEASLLTVQSGGPGTYVVGVSIRPRELTLDGKTFNAYLEEDGITDVLEQRRRNHRLDTAARERYSKHVKAIIQVGDARTDSFSTPLGYPAEIVPLANPYTLRVGDQLAVRCLVDGKPVPDQAVIAGGDNNGETVERRILRTNRDGIATITLASPGQWYVKFIHMVASPELEIDYESKWSTLTFEVR